MEAASIAWRPLGRLLVEKGLLTDEELELALAKQQLTGKRLGETIVECGFVSRPELSEALAAQYGIELKTETGFGTGLRAQIQQRHESDRGRVVQIGIAKPLDRAEPEPEAAPAPPLEAVEPQPPSSELLAQLEEQWAKLAAAEEKRAELETALAAAVVERDGRRAQAQRLALRARAARAEQSGQRERRRALSLRFLQRVRERDEEIEGLRAELGQLGEEHDRRRAQAARFLRRTRERDGEIERLVRELERVRDEQRAAQVAGAEQRAELERSLALVAAARDRRRAQAARFLHLARGREAELERCAEESRRLGEAVGTQSDEHRAALAAAEEQRVGLERALAELAIDWDRRHAQAGRFARRARGLGSVVDGLRHDVERLANDVRGCDVEIDRLRAESGRRRAQAVRFARRLRSRPPARARVPDEPATHLVFLQSAAGYGLVEREGPAPAPHTAIELPGGAFVVSGRRRSPLPGDRRPCVVAEPL